SVPGRDRGPALALARRRRRACVARLSWREHAVGSQRTHARNGRALLMDGSAMVPMRTTAAWDCERVDGTRRVTIIRERETRNRLDRFLFELFDTPTERELEFDAVGSAVWLGCDGETTVGELADDLATEFPSE